MRGNVGAERAFAGAGTVPDPISDPMPSLMPDAPPRCLRCGSDSAIPDVRPLSLDSNGVHNPLEVGVRKTPDAIVFKGEIRSKTRAQVCADCGFVEVYAVNPEALWQAHLDRIANGWTR